MWDIVWTDHNRESVGEHRSRKERERTERQEKSADASNSIRSAPSPRIRPVSTQGSSSSTSGVVSSIKSVDSPTPSAQHKSRSGSKAFITSLKSTFSTAFTSSEGSNSATKPVVVANTSTNSTAQKGDASSKSVRDSIFSKYVAEPTSPCGESIAEPSQQPEQLGQPHQPEELESPEQAEQLGQPEKLEPPEQSEQPEQPEQPENPEQPKQSEQPEKLDQQPLRPTTPIPNDPNPTTPRTPEEKLPKMMSQFAVSPAGARGHSMIPVAPRIGFSERTPSRDSPVGLTPGRSSRGTSSLARRMDAFKPNNPDSWTPCKRSEGKSSMPPARPQTLYAIFVPPPVSLPNEVPRKRLQHIKRTVMRMSSEDPQGILDRLNEIWTLLPIYSVGDDLYKKLDTERKLWLFSWLDKLGTVAKPDPHDPPSPKVARPEARNVLAVYESQARASYLAAVNQDRDVFHLSMMPLPRDYVANVQPLVIPSVAPAYYPSTPKVFGKVYSLSLPSLCASHLIPLILNRIYRSLAPGGVFYLTVIDPMPNINLGPRMHHWLADNLMFNIEKRHRCTRPTKLLPEWLWGASLRGDGSEIMTINFHAVAPFSLDDEALAGKPVKFERALKHEACSKMGRMLWIEVWGPFVTGGSWWWDDPECVEECLVMDTRWEYCQIQACPDV